MISKKTTSKNTESATKPTSSSTSKNTAAAKTIPK
jgi:hypothetical protein